MDNTIIALAVGAVIIVIDVLLHGSQAARNLFAGLARKVPRKLIWTVFLASVAAASHLVSGYAMIALVIAIATFGFVMAAWRAAQGGSSPSTRPAASRSS